MREAYRVQKTELEASLQNNGLQAVVFFMYTGKELPDFLLVKNQMQLLIRKMVKVFHEKGSVHT